MWPGGICTQPHHLEAQGGSPRAQGQRDPIKRKEVGRGGGQRHNNTKNKIYMFLKRKHQTTSELSHRDTALLQPQAYISDYNFSTTIGTTVTEQGTNKKWQVGTMSHDDLRLLSHDPPAAKTQTHPTHHIKSKGYKDSNSKQSTLVEELDSV